jgi:hypothetical protein
MRAPWSRLTGRARILVLCATVLLIASGLCGTQLLILNAVPNGSGNNLTALFMITGILELVAMALSAAGVIVAALVWGISALYAGLTSKD